MKVVRTPAGYVTSMTEAEFNILSKLYEIGRQIARNTNLVAPLTDGEFVLLETSRIGASDWNTIDEDKR